jgi:predicted lipid-binding transport protein (Tim44 family)
VELLVATWTVRFAFIAAVAVLAISLSAGSVLVDAVLRAAVAAFVFTFAGRLLIGFLETPEQRMHRLRNERAKRDRTGGKSTDKAAKSQDKPAAKAAKVAKAAKSEQPAATSVGGERAA